MTRSRYRLTAVASAFALTAWGAAGTLKLEPESRLWVDGTSTVRSWTCRAGVVEAGFETAADDVTSRLLAGEQALKTVSLTVPAAKMDCGNGTMNGHMYKAIKSNEFPTITFALQGYTLVSAPEGTKTTMTGSLTLGGVAKPITVDATLSPGATGGLRVAGSYELNMRDYHLNPPSLMLGAMKVGEKVKVNFDLLLK